jgi:hypothetical protein
VHWQHTHLITKEKRKRKRKINKQKETPKSDRKPRKEKSKITWRRQVSDPLGKGNGSTHPRQNHAQAKSTNHQSIQELPLHICKLPLNKCQPWTCACSVAKIGHTGFQNRSNRFSSIAHSKS